MLSEQVELPEVTQSPDELKATKIARVNNAASELHEGLRDLAKFYTSRGVVCKSATIFGDALNDTKLRPSILIDSEATLRRPNESATSKELLRDNQ